MTRTDADGSRRPAAMTDDLRGDAVAPLPKLAATNGRDLFTTDGPAPATPAVIHLIEDNPAVREAERILFESEGWEVQDHHSAEDFLAAARPTGDACLVVDVVLPGQDGVALLALLRAEGFSVPAIMLTGRGDAATAVAALKAGAADFIEKPADSALLLAAVKAALDNARDDRARLQARELAKARFDQITSRERDVLMMVLDGLPNKIIAADLDISQRTVENHRASVMQKTGTTSVPSLVKLFLQARGQP